MSNNKEDSTATQTVIDQLDVDIDEQEQFSDLGASIDTDLTSLTSTIRDHVYENGRRYHSLNAGTYSIPNDEPEQERLDMVHHAVNLMFDGALHAVKLPKKLDRILDLGTGTGIWAIDMADEHPESQVIGVDLSPIQPTWVPPNCTFEVDDIEKPWLWKVDQPFDFIHSRNLAQGIRDWPTYTKRIYDNLAPGGVVQLHEAEIAFKTDDDSVPKGGYLERYQKEFAKAVDLAGLQEASDQLEGYLRDAGFVDIRVLVKKLPMGPWPKDKKTKEIGKWGLAIAAQGLTSYGFAMFTRQLKMSTEEATEICDGAFVELRRRDVHTYFALWCVEGRKPEDAEPCTSQE